MTKKAAPIRFTIRQTCRICAPREKGGFPITPGLMPILTLPDQPLADKFLDTTSAQDDRYPLLLAYCRHCDLVQQMVDVDDELLFGDDYAFFTGASPSSISYFADYAKDIMARFPLGTGGTIVEIASNDGTLLEHFRDAGYSVLGIEPATPPANLAIEHNIPTLIKPFNSQTANEVMHAYKRVPVILANNVVAHVRVLHDFMAGIDLLLDEQGMFVFEVQYLPHLLFPGAFDHVYHEHRSFFSLLSLTRLLAEHQLRIFDVLPADTQGGSIRVYACHGQADFVATPAVAALRHYEEKLGLDYERTYWGLQSRVNYTIEKLRALLIDLRAQGKTVYGFGASAKGNTLLNSAGIGPDLVPFITDLTPYKIGKYAPGTGILVVAPDSVPPPDYYLLLVWNYLDGILKREEAFRQAGGKFIVPIPTPIVI